MSTVEVQDIFRDYGAAFLDKHALNFEQMKAYYAILNCRTSRLGAHIDKCEGCGHERISYNSCRNRHCPKCQTAAKEQWIENQERYLLNVGYFHVVFTVPSELNPIFRQNQKAMYDLLFKAASETLLELCANPKYLGAKPGITAILHTWGQNLSFHPHLHCLVTGGGLTADSKWQNSRKKFFIPAKVLSAKFQGKFMALMRAMSLRFGGSAEPLNRPGEYGAFIAQMYRKPWVTYCKPPFGNAAKVIQYLGRYTHRVAISNNRILSAKGGSVTFSYRDYADGSRKKVMALAAAEFIRRFMLHVLPKGLRKIRHYGILASGGKTKRIALCRRLTGTATPARLEPRKVFEILKDKLGPSFCKCPRCGGTLSRAAPLCVR